MHDWDISPAEAVKLQKKLSSDLIIGGMPSGVTTIAGVDCAFNKNDHTGFCAVILFSSPDLGIIEERYSRSPVTFPYVPGLLSFREGPLIMKTLSLLSRRPDILVFDGQGIAHPRRFGIASHLGLVCGIPSIGCAKSRLYGRYEEPGMNAGDRSRLLGDDGEPVGVVLRTRTGVKPVFVSPGHLIGIDEAVDFIEQCVRLHRVPFPTRIADIKVAAYKKSCLS